MRMPIRFFALFFSSTVMLGFLAPSLRGNAEALGKAEAKAGSFAYAEISIDRAQALMQEGKLSSVELTQAYLKRIAEIDRQGPSLHAVIETNPDALAIATTLDAERKNGKLRGPLHGIPVLIKDNIGTADRMETTAGSLALVGAKPASDAFLVARLRAAGAVILGKTNLSEWANFRSTNSTSGWSARGGQTRNPYALDRNPSGSSSGSAAAVAANLCVVAVGTETDGSIVSPASKCGLVGVKPTVGFVSRSGVIPISYTTDTAGPMTRTVRDAALLLEALAGVDEADAVTKTRPRTCDPHSLASLKVGALRGARIGVLHGPFGFSPRTEPVLIKAQESLKVSGAELVDLGEMAALNEVGSAELDMLLFEFKEGLNRYLSGLGATAQVHTLTELIAFNEKHAAEEMPHFGQELFLQAEAKGAQDTEATNKAREKCLRLLRTEGVDALMAKHKLDAIVMLTSDPARLTDALLGDAMGGESSTLAAVIGYPSVTVPAGDVAGLPVGLSFVGRAWDDAQLLGLAADFEAHAQARKPPKGF